MRTIEEALAAWDKDANLPICVACGTQYTSHQASCIVCLDERQFVPDSGQQWTSLSKLEQENHTNEILTDRQDQRIRFIKTTPTFAIGQTPFIIETANGSFLWECSAFLSKALINVLLALDKPLKAIAISHPHFYSTSMTWARVLGVPVVICGKDKSWYQRAAEIETQSKEVIFYDEESNLADNLKVLRCGGHFEGSAILYWDRSSEPEPGHETYRKDGIIFCSDTAMVQPTQKGFTFQYSVPNMIPMDAYDVARIYQKLAPYTFCQATSSWPARFIREDAGVIMAQSVRQHLEALSYDWLWASLVQSQRDGTAGRQAAGESNSQLLKWKSADLLGDIPPEQKEAQSLVILNQPITRRDTLELVWNNCEYRICADGGANRLYDVLDEDERQRFLPDMIKGDLDSLRDDVRAFYESHGTKVVRVDDEYSTDLQKCLDEVKTRMKDAKNPTVILLGGLSGRLDQTTHVLSFLQKLRRRSGPPSRLDKQAETLPWKQSDFKVFMGDQVVSSSLYQAHEQSVDQHKVEDLPDIRVVSENCVAWVLDSGEHHIQIDHDIYGQTCGVLPLGVESSHVLTTGLRWDFDWQTSFSTMISTSNHLDPSREWVTIKTSRPVWWTMEIKDLNHRTRLQCV